MGDKAQIFVNTKAQRREGAKFLKLRFKNYKSSRLCAFVP
jgi:hypothetical protein